MEVIWAALIGAGATVAATIMSFYYKNKNECLHKSELLKNHVDQNANVYALLDYTMEKIGCDRVHVFEFHNGDTYYSGSSQQKFSSTYEEVQNGVSSEAMNLQNLRISTFNTLIKDVIKNECFLCESIESVSSQTERAHLQRQGVKSVYSFSITTLTGKIIGIFSIDFVQSQRSLTEGDKSFLLNQALILSGYLCED